MIGDSWGDSGGMIDEGEAKGGGMGEFPQGGTERGGGDRGGGTTTW